MRSTLTLVLSALLLPPAAFAQDRCTAQGQAEQDRIAREFSAQRPAKGDRDAELAWSRNLQAALAAGAQRAEECSRAERRAAAPANAAKEQDCIAASNRRADELQQRYRGRVMSSAEQAQQRSEEQQLMDERMACSRAAKR